MKRFLTLACLCLSLLAAGSLGSSTAAADPGDFCVVEGKMELAQTWNGNGGQQPQIEYYSTACVVAGTQITPSSPSLSWYTAYAILCDSYEMYGYFSASDPSVQLRFQTTLAGGHGVLTEWPDSSPYQGWGASWSNVATEGSKPIGTIDMTPLRNQQDGENEVDGALFTATNPQYGPQTNVGCEPKRMTDGGNALDYRKKRYFEMVFAI